MHLIQVLVGAESAQKQETAYALGKILVRVLQENSLRRKRTSDRREQALAEELRASKGEHAVRSPAKAQLSPPKREPPLASSALRSVSGASQSPPRTRTSARPPPSEYSVLQKSTSQALRLNSEVPEV